MLGVGDFVLSVLRVSMVRSRGRLEMGLVLGGGL